MRAYCSTFAAEGVFALMSIKYDTSTWSNLPWRSNSSFSEIKSTVMERSDIATIASKMMRFFSMYMASGMIISMTLFIAFLSSIIEPSTAISASSECGGTLPPISASETVCGGRVPEVRANFATKSAIEFYVYAFSSNNDRIYCEYNHNNSHCNPRKRTQC